MERLSTTPREKFVHELKQELMDMTAAFACGSVERDVTPINVHCEIDAGWVREARRELIYTVNELVFTETDYGMIINLRAYSAKREQLNDAEEREESKALRSTGTRRARKRL